MDNGHSRGLFDAIDALLRQNQDEHIDEDSSQNPVSALISPEWHYSDSSKILDTVKLSWNSLEDYDVVKSMSKNLDKTIIQHGFVGGEFERTFCSWYQPYHYLARIKWGIHIRYDSWMRISALFFQSCPSLVDRSSESVRAAFLYLYTHELFHHLVENAASTIEILIKKPLIYTGYYSNIYLPVFNTPACIEESLSNRYLFGMAQECHVDKKFLECELLKQGPGYNDFSKYGGSKFVDGKRMLLSQILHSSLNPPSLEAIEHLLNLPSPIEYANLHDVPIWLHREARSVF